MPSLILCFLLLPVLLLLFKYFLRPRNPLPLPPGPKPLPFVGNMSPTQTLTHRSLSVLADRYGGLFYLRLGSLHTVTISSPLFAKQALQTLDHIFSNRPASIAISYLTYDRSDMAFANYGPFWRQMRKLCVTRLFSRKRAASFSSVRLHLQSTLLSLSSQINSPVNLGLVVFNLTMNITLRAAFGAQTSENEAEFIGILQEFSKLFGAFNVGDFVPWLRWLDLNGIKGRLRKARRELDWFIDRIIEEHMRNPKEGDAEDSDMVHDMLAFYEENGDGKDLQGFLKLTKDNIKAIIMVIVD